MLPKLNKGGVIHSYTSGKELAIFALENDLHIGFNGIITFNKADNVREILEMTPLKQILRSFDRSIHFH